MQKKRVLVGILGLDQHEVGAIGVARMLRDSGMEVIYTGKFNLPGTIVKTSVEEDIDLIGLSCHSWEYLHYVPELMALMKEKQLDIPVVVGGSVVTRKDELDLEKNGVAASFGPSSTNQEILDKINRIIKQSQSIRIKTLK